MKFSVLIPTRDRLELLKAAVQSVLQQDYEDFEIVVSDNCSAEPAAPWIESLHDPRIKSLVQDSPIPVTDNWNRALAEATGDYVLMLGDDDALLPGYFQAVRRLLDRYDEPDCIYHGAYLFTYPGVIPGQAEGSLHPSRNAVFWRDGASTYLLDRGTRRQLVTDALSLKNSYGFNMQFVLLKHALIRAIAADESFYQSPYPDYYAMNLVMLEADRVLVHEAPLICIGVSPRSFGWYFLNRQEGSGNEHLGIADDGIEAAGIDSASYLPGTSMNTHWLLSMATLSRRIGDAPELPPPSIANYRRKQIIFFCILIACRQASTADRAAFRESLTTTERALFGVLSVIARFGAPGGRLLSTLHRLSEKTPRYVFRVLTRRLRARPEYDVVKPGQGILDAPQIVATRQRG